MLRSSPPEGRDEPVRYDSTLIPAVVVGARPAADDVRLIEITPVDERVRSYTPGSHLNVGVMIGERPDTRSYSLVGEPDPTRYRIAVKRQSESRGGSVYMWGLEPGDRISVSAPNNLFDLEYGRPEYLLVAGGIGITPIYGMAMALARRGADFTLAYAGSHRTSLPFVEELSEALGDRLRLCLTDEGTRLDLPAEIDRLHPEASLYVCGPLRLLDATRRAWHQAGRPPTKLRYETFGSSGSHTPEPFWVRLAGTAREFMVSESTSLLEVLRSEGVEVVSDCERGECGICQLDVVEVAGYIDHRDVFFSDTEKKANHKLCVCVSRVVGGGVVLDALYRPDAPVV